MVSGRTRRKRRREERKGGAWDGKDSSPHVIPSVARDREGRAARHPRHQVPRYARDDVQGRYGADDGRGISRDLNFAISTRTNGSTSLARIAGLKRWPCTKSQACSL